MIQEAQKEPSQENLTDIEKRTGKIIATPIPEKAEIIFLSNKPPTSENILDQSILTHRQIESLEDSYHHILRRTDEDARMEEQRQLSLAEEANLFQYWIQFSEMKKYLKPQD